tara:strand:- start:20060 stop:20740 length:681 start_codon:yes stop_codon:yes gene_type:complete
MTNRLLIIPARAGSKRIKEKNIKKFLGKPIISYTLNNAKKSKLFSKIHISTESNKVKRVVKKLGYKIDFLRPKKLSKNNTPTIDVLRFVYNKYKQSKLNFDEVWTISCCSPLINENDLIRASKLTKKNKVLLSITKYNAPVEWAFRVNKNNSLKPHFPRKLFKNSQNFSEKYHDAGAFAVFPISFLKKKNINLENNFTGFVLPREKAVDIDNLDDWKLAELLYKLN